MTEIDLRWRPRETTLYGERVLVMDIEISDTAPEDVKEGLGRRAVVNAGGVCPCGARIRPPDRAARRRAARNGGMLPATVAHERGCAALFPGYLMVDGGPEVAP